MSHNITHYLPELDEPERSFIAQLTARMADADVQQFAVAYRQGRKDPQMVLLLAAIGFAGVPGLHRFVLGHAGIGFLCLFTSSLLLIGTIVDISSTKSSHLITTEQLQGVSQVISNPTAFSSKGSGTCNLFGANERE